MYEVRLERDGDACCHPNGRHGDGALLALPRRRAPAVYRDEPRTRSTFPGADQEPVVRLRARDEDSIRYFMLDRRISTQARPSTALLGSVAHSTAAPVPHSMPRSLQDDRPPGSPDASWATPCQALLTAFVKRGLKLVVFDLDACTASLPWEWVPGSQAPAERVPTCRTPRRSASAQCRS